ncbi:MAG: prepilin-type N-terminal cleavage/methylation domain-containing protein [Candidatus Doudnabacteria bacterium]|nr:prepilin-type N-terminal cleavage/methylation domain-containing protein [Candidatus Doudnabacteria bacterium]
MKKFMQKGFTLIELLVVIAIIGILSAVVLVSLNSARAKSRDARRLADVRQVMTALELYYNDNGQYPTTAQGLAILSTSNFLPTTPAQPTGGTCNVATYAYTSPRVAGNSSTYQVTFCIENAGNGWTTGNKTADERGLQQS